jgi:hypothetical protein
LGEALDGHYFLAACTEGGHDARWDESAVEE